MAQKAGYLFGWAGGDLSYRMGWGEEDRAAWPVVDAGRREAEAAAMGEKIGALEAEKGAHPFPPGAHRSGGVLGRKGVKAVAASGHTLAVTVDGALYSFGRNWDSRRRKAGQLGRKGPFGRPGRVGGVAGRVRAVAAGKFHSVAVTEEGVVYTWGCNGRGQLGRQTRSMGSYPFTWGPNVFPLLFPSSYLPGRQAQGGASEGATGKRGGGGGGSSRPALLPRPIFPASTLSFTLTLFPITQGDRHEAAPVRGALENVVVVAAAAGPHYSLALSAGGQGDRHEAAPVRGPMENVVVVAAAAGPHYSLALSAGGQTEGRVGGALEGERVVEIAAGEEHWLALTDKGHVYACSTGFNASGVRVNPALHAPLLAHLIPSPSSSSSHTRFSLPHRITSGPLSSERASTIGAAAGASFAVMASSQKLLSWGYGGGKGVPAAAGGAAAAARGSVLLGRTGGAAEEPSGGAADYSGKSGRRVITVPPLESPSGVWSWGHNNYHQLGRPTPNSADPLPGLVGGLACLHVDTVAAGSHHGLAFGRAERGKELEVAGEWFAQLPHSGFDPSFRNPCWKGGSGFHCLPYFLVIGAMRSGAQDFFHRLTMAHPTALQPASMVNPEWWDMREYDPLDWYTGKFQPAAAHIATHPTAIAGEVTPSLLTHSGILARGPHARSFLLPELIFSLLPHARFIVLLRNPIHRWFSSFLSAKQQDDSHITFDSSDSSSTAADAFTQHVDAVLPAIKGCMVDHSPVYCSRLLFHSFPHVCRSMYAYFLSVSRHSSLPSSPSSMPSFPPHVPTAYR
ncbi:unnamed protein product [Closterium sp. Naga37s-1]|nr:unnamed protein product [Closterium sp. Naga37s-1]